MNPEQLQVIKKTNENLFMYFIMNKKKCQEKLNKDIYQYFGDAIFR